MAKVSIARRMTDDENTRVYHSRYQLTEIGVIIAQKGNTPSEEQWAADPRGAGIMSAFLDIPGISMVQLQAYTAAIMKAEMFSWAEIEPYILRLMSSLNLDLEVSVLAQDLLKEESDEGEPPTSAE